MTAPTGWNPQRSKNRPIIFDFQKLRQNWTAKRPGFDGIRHLFVRNGTVFDVSCWAHLSSLFTSTMHFNRKPPTRAMEYATRAMEYDRKPHGPQQTLIATMQKQPGARSKTTLSAKKSSGIMQDKSSITSTVALWNLHQRSWFELALIDQTIHRITNEIIYHVCFVSEGWRSDGLESRNQLKHYRFGKMNATIHIVWKLERIIFILLLQCLNEIRNILPIYGRSIACIQRRSEKDIKGIRQIQQSTIFESRSDLSCYCTA